MEITVNGIKISCPDGNIKGDVDITGNMKYEM